MFLMTAVMTKVQDMESSADDIWVVAMRKE